MDDNSSKKINIICLDYVIKRILNYRQKNDVFVMETFLNAVLEYFNYKTVKIDRLHDKESLGLEEKSITDFSAIDEDGRTYIEVERFPKSVVVRIAEFNISTVALCYDTAGKEFKFKKMFRVTVVFGEAKGCKPPQKSKGLDELGVVFQFKTALTSGKGGKIVKPLYIPNVLKNTLHVLPVYFYVYVDRFVFNKENDTMKGKSVLEQWLYMFKYGEVKSFFQSH